MSDDLPLYPPPLYTPPLPPHTDTRHAGHSVLLTFYRVHTDLEMRGGDCQGGPAWRSVVVNLAPKFSKNCLSLLNGGAVRIGCTVAW